MKPKRKNSDARSSGTATPQVILVVIVALLFGAGLPFYFMFTSPDSMEMPEDTTLTLQELGILSPDLDAELPPLAVPGAITSPDGKWLASVETTEDNQHVILYDTSAQERDRIPFYAQGSDITALAFHPSSDWLAVGTYEDVQLINIYAPEQRYYPINETERVRDIAFNEEGTTLAIATQEDVQVGYIILINLHDLQQPGDIIALGETQIRFAVPSVARLTFTEEGYVGALSDEGFFYRWDSDGELR